MDGHTLIKVAKGALQIRVQATIVSRRNLGKRGDSRFGEGFEDSRLILPFPAQAAQQTEGDRVCETFTLITGAC